LGLIASEAVNLVSGVALTDDTHEAREVEIAILTFDAKARRVNRQVLFSKTRNVLASVDA